MVEIYLPSEKDIDYFSDEVYEGFDVVIRNKIVITDKKSLIG